MENGECDDGFMNGRNTKYSQSMISMQIQTKQKTTPSLPANEPSIIIIVNNLCEIARYMLYKCVPSFVDGLTRLPKIYSYYIRIANTPVCTISF